MPRTLQTSVRDREVMELVRETPGLTSTQLSKHWGCSLQYASSYLVRGIELGTLTRAHVAPGKAGKQAFGYYPSETYKPEFGDLTLDQAQVMQVLNKIDHMDIERAPLLPKDALSVAEIYKYSNYQLRMSSINHHLNGLYMLGYTDHKVYGRAKYHRLTANGKWLYGKFEEWQEKLNGVGDANSNS